MITRMGAAVLALISGVVLAGCGIDKSLQSVPPPDVFTVSIDVRPPISLRTQETWDDWMTPVQAVFHTTFDSSAYEGDGHTGHTHNPIDHISSDIFIGRVETGGFGIEVRSGAAETTWTIGASGPEIHPPIEGETRRLHVILEDAIGQRAVTGNSIIPNARLSLAVSGNGTNQAIDLQPVQGPRGFRYEANASIPLGVYDLKVHAAPPNFYWSSATRECWTEPVTAELPGYDLSAGSGNASVETGGLRITVRAESPKVYGLSYGTFGMGLLPLNLRGDETVNFSVRLEDLASLASGVGQRITNCQVEVTVMNETSGTIMNKILYPMYGEQGFYYATNLVLPGN